MNSLAQFGVVGLGVMGKSLALNLAEKELTYLYLIDIYQVRKKTLLLIS